MNVPSAVTSPKETAFMSGYLDALAMVERLHRLLLKNVMGWMLPPTAASKCTRLALLEVSIIERKHP